MAGFGGKGAFRLMARLLGLGAGCLVLANCSGGFGKIDPKYGVSASARVVAPGEPVPKGGGVYRVGKPYTVGGRTYVPEEDASYKAVGYASWYGDDFHGRYTANGEIFDMNSISAAHPTMPLPSYARVTNLTNHRSIVVRVNDRGPYAGNRVIDLSVKTAQLLGFYGKGVTKVKVEYVGRAPLAGSDDRKLIATLREGVPAPARSVMVASSQSSSADMMAAPGKAYRPTYFDARPMSDIPRPVERPYRLGGGASQVAVAGPEEDQRPTTELAAAARPHGPATVERAPIGPAETAVSPVSAYAPTRYDGHAGFMSGRGLY
jgi:rare lipoprotein A